MPSYCTLFCAKAEPALVPASLIGLLDGRGQITTEGAPAEWARISVAAPGASLVLSSQRFREGGDAFSHMILGLYNYFRQVDTAAAPVKATVLERVAGCRYAVGVVAEPEFSEEAGHYACIFGLAEALDALIWTGSGVVAASGRLLLDGDGRTEEA